METRPPQYNSSQQPFTSHYIAQQQTMPYPLVTAPPLAGAFPPMPPDGISPSTRKRKITRLLAVLLVCLLALTLFFVWRASPAPSPAPAIPQQNPDVSSTASSSTSTTNTNDMIHVYVVGAVKHPGVYRLANDARVYNLLQAAGGVRPQANLVALNLAARLTDGQEVYVTMVGEPLPTCLGGAPGSGSNAGNTSSTGQLVNINTASSEELRQQLHISSTTAAAIVNYRLQHGSYTTVDQLSQVVSKSIYDKIKGMVTVQ